MAHPWTITDIREETRLDPKVPGGFLKVMMVAYKVGEDGPFTLEVPAAEFSQQAVEQRLNTVAQHIAGLRS